MTLFYTTPHTDPRPVAQNYMPDNPPPCCLLVDWLRATHTPLETVGALRLELMTGAPVPFAGGELIWSET